MVVKIPYAGSDNARQRGLPLLDIGFAPPFGKRFAKKAVIIAGSKTSVCLEPIFWSELKKIANRRRLPVSYLIRVIKETRVDKKNLASSLRVYIVQSILNQSSRPDR
jgi:predicted DNA-binding ribbon-helix-helix protein